jgi:signal transduction histidine kinase
MAAKDGPRILRATSGVHDDGGVMLSVADTGPGIGSQDVERIFNPLFTTKSDGMGMGLSICRSIIEAHDGRLWAAPIPRGPPALRQEQPGRGRRADDAPHPLRGGCGA